MPWSHPAPRMREFVLAMRAIWASWNDGTKLDFRGDFYTHTLMTPFFDPGPEPVRQAEGVPRGRRRRDDRGRGRGGDGMLLHPFTTERYVREVTMPALERGFAKAGRTRDGFEIGGPMFVVTGHHRGGEGRGGHGHEAAARVLRLDARVPAGARAARLGRDRRRAQHDVEARRVGRDGRPHHRRDARDVRGGRRARRRRRRCSAPASARSSTASASTLPTRSAPTTPTA